LAVFSAQTVTVTKFDQIEKLIASGNDTTYVFNFWATWCVPCVKEFPSFQALAGKHKNEKVKVVMCSLDFKSEYGDSSGPISGQASYRCTESI
jgi:thiol-disulfide isomerase/thioredoxin